MKPLLMRIAILTSVAAVTVRAPSETLSPQPFARTLECSNGDCSLLNGRPQTAGMRSGFVRLKPGESVGWHTTGQHEESLVILRGQGAALIEGQAQHPFTAPAFAYIPPETRHNVTNTGASILEYVYVVAPIAGESHR